MADEEKMRNDFGETKGEVWFSAFKFFVLTIAFVFFAVEMSGFFLIFAILTFFVTMFDLYNCITFDKNAKKQKNAPPVMSVEERWYAEVNQYKAILGKLPREQVKEAHNIIRKTGLSMGLPYEELPEKLSQALKAGTDLLKEGTFGEITNEQMKAVNNALKNFERNMATLIPAIRNQIGIASSEGLDFGLITNSSADMMLYGAMNAHEKNKNTKITISAVNKLVDKELLEFFEEIQKIVP